MRIRNGCSSAFNNSSIILTLLRLLAAVFCITIYVGWVQRAGIENTWMKFRRVTMVLCGLFLCHSLKHRLVAQKAGKVLFDEEYKRLRIRSLFSGRLCIVLLDVVVAM